MKQFALIGAAGYIAPRHMKAIQETGNELVAAFDPNDSVGIIDRYFPQASFFTEFERFDRHVDKLRRQGTSAIDFVTVCSPNYLHDSHIRFALRSGAHVVCEKPIVLNPWNLDALQAIEADTGRRVYSVLQLRLHPAIVALREKMNQMPVDTKLDVTLTYISARGKWYFHSWKGDEKKSGGVTTNIGVHLFDVLHYLFGKLLNNQLHYRTEQKAGGWLEYERARVRWFLSVDAEDLPAEATNVREPIYRHLQVNDDLIDLSDGFADLHTAVYRGILAGEGFGMETNRSAIETTSAIRSMPPQGLTGDYHPFLKNNQ